MPEEPRSFAEIATARGRVNGCRRCGAATAAAVQVACRTKDKHALASKSLSFCEPCAVITYEAAVAVLQDADRA